MLKASQFRLASAQAVIFTPHLAEFSQGKLLASVLTRFSHQYDGPVEAVTLPENAPPHAPRVSLKSKDEVWRLQASPARSDAIWVRPGAGWVDTPQEELSDIERVLVCAEVLEHLVRTVGVTVGRMALVVNSICAVANPPEEMIAHFAHPEVRRAALRGSAGFEVHNLTKYPLPSGLIINHWVRCRSGMIAPSQQPIVSVEQDLNTLEEDLLQRRYSPEAIREYFEHATAEAATVLARYFPETE